MSHPKQPQPRLSGNEREELFSLLFGLKSAITESDQNRPRHSSDLGHTGDLSPREMEVLRLVSLGKNNSEIAQELFISLNTVTRHMTNIFYKTGAANRVAAAVYAAQHGLL